MHKLLARQLRQHFGSADEIPAELQSFIESVDRAYHQSDDDRAMLEHSIDTVSVELVDRYGLLKNALSDSQRAQRELTETLALLEATLESTTDGLLVVDAAGRMVIMNRKFIEIWGIPDDVISSRDDTRALEFVLAQLVEPEAFLEKVRELYDDPNADSFDTLLFRDRRVVERYSIPQRIGGTPVGRVWSFRDVTTRLRLEDQLRQSQKIEAMGQLAGGVAHDFNNLLTVIIGHIHLLQHDPTLRAEHREDLTHCLTAAERAAELTRQLLAFGRKQVMRPEWLDLNDIVRGVQPMLSMLIGSHIRIVVAADPRIGTVLADRGQIEQVIVNLIVNARDAMPDGGQITIGTESIIQPADETAVNPVPPGCYAVLSVADTGTGIPPEILERVFEPFFTTKDIGKGTGLGLATVHGVVSQSGGFLAVDTVPGSGTTFRIHLPSNGSVPDPRGTG